MHVTTKTTSKNTNTSLVKSPKKPVVKKHGEAEKAPASGDKVEIKKFNPNEIPAGDDTSPKPVQEPTEKSGYEGDEIPADDDGPGAGGGYEEEVESDGPGAGGGYFTEQFGNTSTNFWQGPLTVYGSMGTHEMKAFTTEYTPDWVQVMPQETFSWTGTGALMVDTSGTVVGPVHGKAANDAKVTDKAVAEKAAAKSQAKDKAEGKS